MKPTPDPARRLLAAVTRRAVLDYIAPPSGLKHWERVDAAAFLWSQEGRRLLAFFLGVPEQREQAALLWLKARRKERMRIIRNGKVRQ